MGKLKWLLGSQKRQPDSASPSITNPTSQPSPTDNPPSYEQDQLSRLQNEPHQAQSRPRNPSPSPPQLSNSAPYITEDAPKYAFSQASQAQYHQADEKQNPSPLSETDPTALLLENGWDTTEWAPTLNRKERNSALYWAATNGHVATVRYLMQNGASGMSNAAGVNPGTGGSPNSALASAAAANHVGIVRMLLEQATAEDLGGDSALRDAARGGHDEVVRVLLGKWPAATERYEFSRLGALACAAERGHEEVVRLFLERSVGLAVPPQMAERAALCRAAGAGQAGIVKLLLGQEKAFASTDFTVEVALSSAVEKGHADIVRMLLERGVVADFEIAMFNAVLRGDEPILRLLLEAGARPTPVVVVGVNEGDHSTMQLLLEYGAEAGKGLKAAAMSGNS